jgi:hypothetical protein
MPPQDRSLIDKWDTKKGKRSYPWRRCPPPPWCSCEASPPGSCWARRGWTWSIITIEKCGFPFGITFIFNIIKKTWSSFCLHMLTYFLFLNPCLSQRNSTNWKYILTVSPRKLIWCGGADLNASAHSSKRDNFPKKAHLLRKLTWMRLRRALSEIISPRKLIFCRSLPECVCAEL